MIEIVGSEAEALPVESQPADVFLDGVHVLLLFFFGIGVVEAQVGASAKLVGESEIQADRFGVPNVEMSVRLRRKAGLHVLVLPGLQVFGDFVTKEIGLVCQDSDRRRLLGLGFVHRIRFGHIYLFYRSCVCGCVLNWRALSLLVSKHLGVDHASESRSHDSCSGC